MIFKKYNKIIQFKDVIRAISLQADFQGFDENEQPIYKESAKPTLTFKGTVKLHGCLPAEQKIRMADNTLKAIKNIKIGDLVLGKDFVSNKIIPTEVKNTIQDGTSTKWYKISKKHSRSTRGQNQSKIVVTGNHKIHTSKGYIQADQLNIGDSLSTFYNDFKYTDDLIEVLTGILISDGYIDTQTGRNYALVWGHKEEHEGYVDYIYNLIGDIGRKSKRKRVSGYGTKMIDAGTKYSYLINDFSKKFFLNNKKIFPVLTLTDKIAAFWYMGDGSLGHHSTQKDRANIAICGFTDNDSISNIKNSLSNFGLSNFTIYKSEGYNRLRLNASDAEIFFTKIRSFVPDCMQYKLPLKHRGFFIEPKTIKVEKIHYTDTAIIEDIEIITTQDKRKYDITTSTGNFFTADTLVHNSNAQLSYTPSEGIRGGKRSALLSNDGNNAHFGFMSYINLNRKYLTELMHSLWEKHCEEFEQIIIYGEWAGFDIQKGVGISEFHKSGFIFDMKVYNTIDETSKWLSIEGIEFKNGLYNINDFPTYSIDIDFNNPKLSQNTMAKLTMDIEKDCPVARKLLGDTEKELIGEGIVWTTEYKKERFIFKTKGAKHQSSGTKVIVMIDEAKLRNVNEFIEYACTENRMNQCIQEVEAKDKSETGKILKWIATDIITEESEALKRNGLEWHQVAKGISTKMRLFFFNKLDNELLKV